MVKTTDANMMKTSELKKLVVDLLCTCNVPGDDAETTAQVLVAAEMRDIPSHGMLRLTDYIRMLLNGRMNAKAVPSVLHESPSTLTIDGDNGLGPVVADYAMKRAITKARTAGTGWVAVQNSNHFGIAGYYAMQALPHQMIGLCMCNANPLVAPTFAAGGVMGTNPLAIAIPAGKEPPLVADFATAAIARGKVDLLCKQGLPIEEGFVQDADGSPATDPCVLRHGGAILPLGSTRKYGSHKGYCLASAIDILSGLLSGANFGPFVPPSVDWLPLKDHLPGKGTGHFFGAMRIDAFRPEKEFLAAMEQWVSTFRNTKPAAGQEKVYIPGDPEREAEKRNRQTGIRLQEKVKDQIKVVCKELNVACPF